MHVAHISTFPPTLCGIANYANDLMRHLPVAGQSRYSLVYDDYLVESANHTIRMDEWSDYVGAANEINQSDISTVILQHEFGIYGGQDGEYVVSFLELLSKPAITILHTVPSDLNLRRKRILSAIIRASRRVVVLSDLAKSNLHLMPYAPFRNVEVIHHGIPSVTFTDPSSAALRKKMPSNMVFVTFGFMKPKKGIEESLVSFGKFLEIEPSARFIIIGAQQPQFRRCDGYLDTLREMVQELNISDRVLLIGEFLPAVQIAEYVAAADVGVLNYRECEQVSSGVLPFMLGCGRPTISSGFAYAKEVASRCDGVFLTDLASPSNLIETMRRVWYQRDSLSRLMQTTYSQTRSWVWPNVAAQFFEIISDVAGVPERFCRCRPARKARR